MTTQTTTEAARWEVWMDEEARIASFHPVAGYREQRFRNHDHFLEFLQGLQTRGFRFQ